MTQLQNILLSFEGVKGVKGENDDLLVCSNFE
jgi:hypothetical protein